MKKNSILLILALGMMSGVFYNDAFATNGTEQTTKNQERKLTLEDANRLIGEMYSRRSTELVIPDEFTHIENSAFCGYRGFTSITIPDSVQLIGDHAFYRCGGLTSVTIPNSVKSIGKYAFAECSGLTSITIPDSVQSIGNGAFYHCYSCTFIVPNDRIHKLLTDSGVSKYRITIEGKEKPWWWIPVDGKVIIPGDIGEIGNGMFKYRHDITSVDISKGVRSIGNYAFCECSGLTSITIPDSVTEIGNYAFDRCDACTFVVQNNDVKELLIKSGVSQYRIAIQGEKKPWWIPDNGKIVIPGEAERIEYNAFANRSDIKFVEIQKGVESIGKGAFKGCYGLTSITIPDSVKWIDNDAFWICNNLKKICVYSDRVKQLVIDNKSIIHSDRVKIIEKPEGDGK